MGIPYSVECVNCGSIRIALKRDEGVKPLREACPDCGEAEFDVLGHPD